MVSVEANRALTLKRGQSLLDLLISPAIIPDGRTKTSRKRQSPPAQPQSKSYCSRAGSDRSLALGAQRYFPQLLLYWVSQAGLFLNTELPKR
jgi:hypothetical protein